MNTRRFETTAALLLATAVVSFQAVATVAVPGLPAQGVAVTTDAQYGPLFDGPAIVTGGNPGNATSTSRTGPGVPEQVVFPDLNLPPQPQVDGYDEAIASGRASLPGTLGGYSHAGGYSPNGPGGVIAETSARAVTHWMVVASDPSITSAAIDVLAFYDGTLLTGDFAGLSNAGDLFARVNAELNASSGSGNIYSFTASATLDDVDGLNASANWATDFVSAQSPFGASVRQSSVDYSEFLEDAFTVNVGEVFAWEALLSTYAFASAPVELWAVADFLNSAGYELSINTPGLSLMQVPVPLPASLPLMAGALGLVGFARRRAAHR